MNAELSFIYAVNQINHFIIILCRIQISHFIKFNLIKAYFVDAEATVLVLQSEKNELLKNLIFFNMNFTQTETVFFNEIIIFCEFMNKIKRFINEV